MWMCPSLRLHAMLNPVINELEAVLGRWVIHQIMRSILNRMKSLIFGFSHLIKIFTSMDWYAFVLGAMQHAKGRFKAGNDIRLDFLQRQHKIKGGPQSELFTGRIQAHFHITRISVMFNDSIISPDSIWW